MPRNEEQRRLYIVCGEGSHDNVSAAHMVVWSPIRHAFLTAHGAIVDRFGDFGPSEFRGCELDREQQQALDIALHKEAQARRSFRWAPLAIQHIRWRLTRYCWLKECVRAMIDQYAPSHVVLSSNKDDELRRALIAVAGEHGVAIAVEEGECDQVSSMTYRSAPYGIPLRVDPAWLHAIHWWAVRIVRGRGVTMIERYPNCTYTTLAATALQYSLHRSVNFIGAAITKILRMLHLSQRESLVELDAGLSIDAFVDLTPEYWTMFPGDEQQLINALLETFFSHYTVRHLDRVAARLAEIMRIMEPIRVITAHDLLDAGRLLAVVARRHNVPIEYMPHGIVFEDYSGRSRDSPFQPQRIRAWNEASAARFRTLGWNAITVAHPSQRGVTLPARPLPSDPERWRVLILLPDWESISHAGREDVAYAHLIDLYRALTSCGIRGSNCSVKFHFTPVHSFAAMQEATCWEMRRVLGMEFRIIDHAVKASVLFPAFDLVILGPTSGIFEAARAGIPLFFYHHSYDRIGALARFPLPRVASVSDLRSAFVQYDLERTGRAYLELARSLTSGPTVDAAT